MDAELLSIMCRTVMHSNAKIAKEASWTIAAIINIIEIQDMDTIANALFVHAIYQVLGDYHNSAIFLQISRVF